MDRTEINAELGRVLSDFDELVTRGSAANLRRRSAGRRWTNRHVLFHMVIGYLVVRTLMPLVHALGRLGWSRRFAAALNAAHRPFHLINYLGSAVGGQLLPPKAMAALLDRTLRALQRRRAAETNAGLALTMHFRTAWDPYFRPQMTVAEVYHYGTQHFDHHRRQLTL